MFKKGRLPKRETKETAGDIFPALARGYSNGAYRDPFKADDKSVPGKDSKLQVYEKQKGANLLGKIRSSHLATALAKIYNTDDDGQSASASSMPTPSPRKAKPAGYTMSLLVSAGDKSKAGAPSTQEAPVQVPVNNNDGTSDTIMQKPVAPRPRSFSTSSIISLSSTKGAQVAVHDQTPRTTSVISLEAHSIASESSLQSSNKENHGVTATSGTTTTRKRALSSPNEDTRPNKKTATVSVGTGDQYSSVDTTLVHGLQPHTGGDGDRDIPDGDELPELQSVADSKDECEESPQAPETTPSAVHPVLPAGSIPRLPLVPKGKFHAPMHAEVGFDIECGARWPPVQERIETDIVPWEEEYKDKEYKDKDKDELPIPYPYDRECSVHPSPFAHVSSDLPPSEEPVVEEGREQDEAPPEDDNKMDQVAAEYLVEPPRPDMPLQTHDVDGVTAWHCRVYCYMVENQCPKRQDVSVPLESGTIVISERSPLAKLFTFYRAERVKVDPSITGWRLQGTSIPIPVHESKRPAIILCHPNILQLPYFPRLLGEANGGPDTLLHHELFAGSGLSLRTRSLLDDLTALVRVARERESIISQRTPARVSNTSRAGPMITPPESVPRRALGVHQAALAREPGPDLLSTSRVSKPCIPQSSGAMSRQITRAEKGKAVDRS
ncbi:hypothetical protein C8Q80DRAFT_1272364 [Daedaleopsis nitida]|nr:hypothetical protein C8Q80DRAFT_1272364 [Daedaleopsis nitida]